MMKIHWFKDSPDVGPDCLCSKCLEPILEGVPIRFFDSETDSEARFHMSCYNSLVEYVHALPEEESQK